VRALGGKVRSHTRSGCHRHTGTLLQPSMAQRLHKQTAPRTAGKNK